MQRETDQDARRRRAEKTAPPMFFLSVLFLALVAALLVLCVESPRPGAPFHRADDAAMPAASGSEWAGELAGTERGAARRPAAVPALLWALALLWPLFVAEALLRMVLRDRQSPRSGGEYWLMLVCFCPPLRLGMRHADMQGRIWLPVIGWQEVNEDLRQRLDRALSIPMLIIALLILPVLLVEFAMVEQVAKHLWLQLALGVSTGLIWFAFAGEFILMIAVAEKKLRYCKQHWLDLAIILLPLISFLRSLRVLRAARAARLARVQQLTKMGRVYRLRGLAMRVFRGVLLVELFRRVLWITPERRLRALREELREKELEADRLRREIAAVEAGIASRQATTVCETGDAAAPLAKPLATQFAERPGMEA